LIVKNISDTNGNFLQIVPVYLLQIYDLSVSDGGMSDKSCRNKQQTSYKIIGNRRIRTGT
jgi:hypothetical protein